MDKELTGAAAHANINLRVFRHRLGLTQKEFIQQFLTDDKQTPKMCVATYSNLESKGGTRIAEVISIVAQKISLDQAAFFLEPEPFVQWLNEVFPQNSEQQLQRYGGEKNGE